MAGLLDAYDQAIAILRSTFSPPEHHLIADTLSRYRDKIATSDRILSHIDRKHEIHAREVKEIFGEAAREGRKK